jgi:hypothetical protein
MSPASETFENRKLSECMGFSVNRPYISKIIWFKKFLPCPYGGALEQFLLQTGYLRCLCSKMLGI